MKKAAMAGLIVCALVLSLGGGTAFAEDAYEQLQDTYDTSTRATDPGLSDESSSYLGGGGFEGGDTSGADSDGSDLQPAPLTITPNE